MLFLFLPFVSDETAESAQTNSCSVATTNSDNPAPCSGGGVAKVVGVLPGLGNYTDSDDSDSSSSDSDIDTDLLKRDRSGQKSAADGCGSSGIAQRHR